MTGQTDAEVAVKLARNYVEAAHAPFCYAFRVIDVGPNSAEDTWIVKVAFKQSTTQYAPSRQLIKVNIATSRIVKVEDILETPEDILHKLYDDGIIESFVRIYLEEEWNAKELDAFLTRIDSIINGKISRETIIRILKHRRQQILGLRVQPE